MGDPVLEGGFGAALDPLADRLARVAGEGPCAAPGAILAQDVIELQRIAVALAAVEDRAGALPLEKVVAHQVADETIDGRALGDDAVAAEVEAKAVALVRSAQAADARLALEDGGLDPEPRELERGAHSAGSAAEHCHVHGRFLRIGRAALSTENASQL
jgi:hypothetical protein